MITSHRILIGSLAVVLGLAMVMPVQATNGYFAHGYGSIAKALAGAGVAMPQDTMAAATNPAGMIQGSSADTTAGGDLDLRLEAVTGSRPGRITSGRNPFRFGSVDASGQSPEPARVAIEAGVSHYWHKYVGWHGRVLGVDSFGESAPYKVVFEHFGLTVDNLVAAVEEVLARTGAVTAD